MSTLIYCQNALSATPYYIEEAALNVYSLEELSYYMLNNVYLLSTKLMSAELCNWIGRELKQPKLANELLGLVQNNAPLHIFVGHILSANGYASAKEIKDTLAIISTFENKSEAERKKIRADRLMANDKLVDAIYEYETLLSDDVAKTMPKIVEGDVYHNLGCAFANCFSLMKQWNALTKPIRKIKRSKAYTAFYMPQDVQETKQNSRSILVNILFQRMMWTKF